MSTLRYVLVDVFTAQPLSGNPLAVFTEATGLAGDTMQALARELNLSETTFVLPPESGGAARVRIFTPRAEIPFAGHPTLGTALVLAELRGLDQLTLELGVGHVPVSIEREQGRAARGWFTRSAPGPIAFDQTAELLTALGVARTSSPVVVYDNGMHHAVVHLDSEAELEGLRPNLSLLAQVRVDTVDVVVAEGAQARLRVFAPAHGVPEDAATGSAAAPILCHLALHAGFDLQQMLEIRQGEGMKRPSRLHVRMASEGAASRLIQVGGAGVIVAEGAFTLPT